MRKRLKKKFHKNKIHELERDWNLSYWNTPPLTLQMIDDLLDEYRKGWWKIIFIPKQKSKSKYTSIIQKVFNEDIKDKWLKFNNIIIDECYTIENEHI